jgi:Flp pilus assembly pilin Flp
VTLPPAPKTGRVRKGLTRVDARSHSGASAAETAIILVLIVVVAFSAVRLFGFQVEDLWERGAAGTTEAGTGQPADENQGGSPGNAGGGGSGIPGVPTTTSSTTTTSP